MTTPSNQQMLKLGLMLQLEKRARRCSASELSFVMVNETGQLVSYRQAMLWDAGKQSITAVSGIAVPDTGSPFLSWLTSVIQKNSFGADYTIFDRSSISDDLASEWENWLPAHGLWVPLLGPSDDLIGALVLFRQEPWSEADKTVFSYLADAYGHAWAFARQNYRPGKRFFQPSKRFRWIAGCLLMILIGLIPMRESSVAPAQVMPHEPAVVRSPVDGVVDDVLVRPNDKIKTDQPLFNLDSTRIRSRIAVATESLAISNTEYTQAAQRSFLDPDAKALMAVLKQRIKQHQADVDYLADLLDRIHVKSPAEGIAVFDDAHEWIGRPVVTGERVMMVANPSAVALEIHLPVSDALPLTSGMGVLFYQNISPLKPLTATTDLVYFTPVVNQDGVASYRVRARFDTSGPYPRIGFKGTAKIYGKKTILAWYLLRKPCVTVMRWLGL